MKRLYTFFKPGIFTSVFLFMFIVIGRSQPVNDDCSGVTPTTLVNGTPVVFNGTTVGATGSFAEMNVLGGVSVWEAVTLTGSCNDLTVSFCGTAPGVQADVWIVYSDCPLTQYFFNTSYNNVDCGDGNWTIIYNGLPAGTYYLPVLADFGNIPGAYTMTVSSIDCPPPPANDLSMNAFPIPPFCDPVTISGTTYQSTSDPDAINCFTSVDGAGVWYTLTGNGFSITADICPNTYDTKLHVYTGSPGSFTCVTGNDDFCGLGSQVTWNSINGTTYYIFVSGFGGDVGTFDLNLSLNDNLAPVPDVMSLPNATGACSATVTTPTATDNCAGSINGVITDTVVNSPGNFTIEWTYDDNHGNTTTQTQNVITSDVISPNITFCPGNITQNNAPGMCLTNVSLGTPTATDNCSVASITNNAPAGGFPIGVTTVTWTVTDPSLNSSTCSQVVTINDGEAPSATCQNITVSLDVNGQATVLAADVDNGSVDNPTQIFNYTYDFTSGPQGFTTGNEPFAYWGLPSISSTWSTTTGFGNPSESYGNMNNGSMGAEHSWIMSPVLSWGTAFDLTFDSYSNNESGTYDAEFVEFSTDGGSTWNSAGTHPSFSTYGDATWHTITFNISSPATSNGRVRFRYDTGDDCCGPFGQQGWYIDNVSISSQVYCGSALSYSLSNSNFDCNDIGTNNVTLTVTDAYSNVDSCSAVITIVDDMPPNVLVQDITVNLNGSGVATITAMDIDNGSTDNCGIVSYALSDSIFGCGDSCSSTYALHFDGGDDYIEGINANLPQGNASRTIEAWINPELISGQIGSIFEWGNISSGERSGIMYNNQRLYYVGENNDVQGLIYIPQNQWSHVAVTYDGSQISLYVNGVADATGYPSTNTTGTTFRIGTGGNSPPVTEYFKGGIDEVRVWDYNRSQAEIVGSMNKCLNGAEPGLVGYYKMEEGTGTTANDNSFSAASGTMNNMTNAAWINASTANLSGAIPVSLTVTDGSGNSASAIAYVTVNDPQSPTFTSCPADVTQCESSGHIVLYTTPAAADNCAVVTVTQISGLASGSNFPLGVTTNTFVAVDPSGNTDTCSFTVSVFTEPTVTFVLNPNNVCLDGGLVTMSGLPAGGIYTGPGTSGNTFNPMAAGLGNHTVSYTYTDANGCFTTENAIYTVISCLGIEGEDGVTATIYPNPSGGIFNISMSELPKGNNTIRLINALGQVMYTAALTSTLQTVDVSTLAAATYYLQIITEEGIISRQIMITHQY